MIKLEGEAEKSTHRMYNSNFHEVSDNIKQHMHGPQKQLEEQQDVDQQTCTQT